jgi:hypothetical protein
VEDKLLLLQIAFSIVAETEEWFSMSPGARLEEIRRAYEKLEKLVDGVPLDGSLN